MHIYMKCVFVICVWIYAYLYLATFWRNLKKNASKIMIFTYIAQTHTSNFNQFPKIYIKYNIKVLIILYLINISNSATHTKIYLNQSKKCTITWALEIDVSVFNGAE